MSLDLDLLLLLPPVSPLLLSLLLSSSVSFPAAKADEESRRTRRTHLNTFIVNYIRCTPSPLTHFTHFSPVMFPLIMYVFT